MNKKELLALLVKNQQAIVDTAKTDKRELTEAEQKSFNELQSTINVLKKEIEDEERAQAEPAQAEPAPAGNANVTAAIEAERSRIAEINDLCRSFGFDSDEYIKQGMSVDAVRSAVLNQLKQNNAPVSVAVTKDEGDKFRAAAVDGLVMRAGFAVDKPAAGADEFRGMSLRGLAVECLVREGRSEGELRRMDKTQLFEEMSRQFYNPSAAFPTIMDQTIKKNIVTMYNEVPTTFEQITSSGTLSDFKTTADHNYVMGGIGDFEYVPEGGELKPSLPKYDMLPQRSLKTYGKQFSMTREAFVNDDISFLASLPGAYAKAAKKTINKQVYQVLMGSNNIFDGKPLFCADHKNIMSSGSAPTADVLQKMILQFKKQVDHFGEPIVIRPKKLIVPIGWEFILAQIFHSATINTPDNTQAVNVLFNKAFEIVEDPYINALAGDKACPWFMMAEASDAKCIQVDYLNGNKTPMIRRMEQAGTLGFTWDIYMDWGINIVDYRGFLKNPGVKL